MKLFLKTSLIVFALCLIMGPAVFGQVETEWRVFSEPKPEIHFPDILDYQTLVCDFHTHTVFSDGQVWPAVRVEEAWREGLDVLAISDHIEYQPHKEEIPTDHNRSYEIASPYAARMNILMPCSTEITRDTPPGHFNAIFLKDIDPLETDDLTDVFRLANEQGGFIFWNHPGWKGIERGKWQDFHEKMYTNEWLHGVEICNGETYYFEAHEYAEEKGLTLIGNSDVHDPMLDHPRTPKNHRTTTLVFVSEKTIPALRDALFNGRTAVWFKNQLLGKPKYLEAIFDASVEIHDPHLSGGNMRYMEIENNSEIDLELERIGGEGPVSLNLPAKGSILVSVKLEGDETVEELELTYRVKNLIVAPNKYLTVNLDVPLE